MIMRLPTLRQLRLLVALAEHCHFGRAAAAVHVTQSTLSASLRELEETLGAALVDRTQRRVVVTPLGNEVVHRAQALLQGAEELVRLANAAAEPLTGPLYLGAIPTVSPFLLPRVLPGLRQAYPNLKLYLVEDLTDRLVERLHAGTLDVVILALPYDYGSGDVFPIGLDPFRLVMPADHALARLPSVPTESIRSEPLLLLTDGHCLRQHALAACDLAAARAGEVFAATSLPTLVQMVDNGLGLTLVPQLALDAGILNGTRLVARPVMGEAAQREIGLVWRKGTARAEEFQLLGQELKRRFEPT